MVGLILGVLGVKLGVPPKKVAFGRSNFRGTRFNIRGTQKIRKGCKPSTYDFMALELYGL